MFSKTKERTASNIIIYKFMKKFIAFRILAITLIATILITSCSKDDETNKSVNENAKVSTYLKSFYATNYQLGKSVEANPKSNSSSLNRSTEVENLIITEVFVGDATIARGYIITDKDTNDFLYFIDVDRVNFKLTSVKVDANDTKIFNNINDLDKYLSTDELDYIKIAEDYSDGINSVEGRRFWGSAYSQGECDPATGLAQLFEDYYVFGIRVKHHAATSLAPGGGNIYEPCGMH